jgi:hypothetical protein
LQERYPEKYGLSFLSGTMAGFAGWTKNEGVLFWVAFLAARGLAIFLSQNRKMQMKQLMYFILGSMPVLAIIIYFKVNLAPSNDLVSAGRSIGEIVLKVTNYTRYIEILKGFVIGILFTLPQVLLLLFYPMYVGINIEKKIKISALSSFLVLTFYDIRIWCNISCLLMTLLAFKILSVTSVAPPVAEYSFNIFYDCTHS